MLCNLYVLILLYIWKESLTKIVSGVRLSFQLSYSKLAFYDGVVYNQLMYSTLGSERMESEYCILKFQDRNSEYPYFKTQNFNTCPCTYQGARGVASADLPGTVATHDRHRRKDHSTVASADFLPVSWHR